MKKSKKIQPETEEISIFSGVVYNSKFINYREDGKIESVSVKPDSDRFLEIDIALIPNFVSGKKSYNNYNIEYFKKIKLGLLTDEDDLDTIVKSDYVYYTIPRDKDTVEVEIFHDAVNRKWIVQFSDMLNPELLLDFTFFIVLKANKNYLLASYLVNTKDLKDRLVEIEFATEEEQCYNNVELLTCKKYKSYAVKELHTICQTK